MIIFQYKDSFQVMKYIYPQQKISRGRFFFAGDIHRRTRETPNLLKNRNMGDKYSSGWDSTQLKLFPHKTKEEEWRVRKNWLTWRKKKMNKIIMAAMVGICLALKITTLAFGVHIRRNKVGSSAIPTIRMVRTKPWVTPSLFHYSSSIHPIF